MSHYEMVDKTKRVEYTYEEPDHHNHHQEAHEESHHFEAGSVSTMFQTFEDPSHILRLAIYSEWLGLLLSLATSIIYTVVAFNAPHWFIIVWAIFSWTNTFGCIYSLVATYLTRKGYVKRGRRPSGLTSILALTFTADAGIIGAMTVIASYLLRDYVVEYSAQLSIVLLWAGLINVPLIASKFVSAKATWLVAEKHKILFKVYSYIAIFSFACYAWFVLILCKFNVVADVKFLYDAFPSFYLWTTFALAIFSIVLSLILLFVNLFNIRVFYILIGFIQMVVCLILSSLAGLQARIANAMATDDANVLLGLLPVRLTIIFAIGTTCYGFVLGSLSFIFASHSRMQLKFRITGTDIAHLTLYGLLTLGLLITFFVVTPFGENNAEVDSDADLV